MANKTPTHGTKKEVLQQPAQVLVFIPPKPNSSFNKTGARTGGYKIRKST